jgi:hypothetical protein
MDLKYGLALLALLTVLVIAWVVVRRGEPRRRLKKYRESWEQRGTVLRINRDRAMRAADHLDVQTQAPPKGELSANGEH